jgi:hypothetical protein
MENFSIPVSLAGVSSFTAGDGPIPTGVYTATITDLKIVARKGAKPGRNLEVTHKITGGHVRDTTKQVPNGREFRVWLGLPGFGATNDKGESSDKAYLGKIRALLESIGYESARLDAPFNFEAAQIANQTVRVFVVESNATQDGNTDYITPAKFDLYTRGDWKPNEQGKPRTNGGIAVGGGLAGVAAIGAGQAGPNMGGGIQGGQGWQGQAPAGGVMGVNPLQGGAPAPTTPNPAFAGGSLGAPTPIGPTPGANGLGGLVR